MKQFRIYIMSFGLLLAASTAFAQNPLSDCEIYFDELELQLKKDQKDTEKYYQAQLEQGNEVIKKDLRNISSNRERREIRKEYKEFVRNLEKEYNKEMDKLEEEFFEALQDSEKDCGRRAVQRRIARFQQEFYNQGRRSRYAW